jgi:hypothetical protein
MSLPPTSEPTRVTSAYAVLPMNATSTAPPMPTIDFGRPLANVVMSPVFGSTREILPVELALSALRAVEDESFVGQVVDPSRLPAFLVGGEPDAVAFDAIWPEGDSLGAHRVGTLGWTVKRRRERDAFWAEHRRVGGRRNRHIKLRPNEIDYYRQQRERDDRPPR